MNEDVNDSDVDFDGDVDVDVDVDAETNAGSMDSAYTARLGLRPLAG